MLKIQNWSQIKCIIEKSLSKNFSRSLFQKSISLLTVLILTLSPSSVFGLITQTIFSYNFTGVNGVPSGWTSNTDGSVGCANFPVSSNDAAIYVVGATNWPGHGQVLTNIANYNSEYGTFVYSIGTRIFTYAGGGTYRVDTEMRLWRTDGEYKADHLGINLTFSSYNASISKYVEHFAEVNVETNPSDPDYGYLMYRRNINDNVTPNASDPGNWERKRIAYVGVDANWHRLIVNTWIDNPSGLYKLASVYWDGTWYEIRRTPSAPVGVELAKRESPWQYEYSLLMLETSNAYTGCAGNVRNIGVGLYDNVKLERDSF